MKFNTLYLLISYLVIAKNVVAGRQLFGGVGTPFRNGERVERRACQMESIEIILSLRAGASSRRKSKSRTAGLSSSAKTLTGKKSVSAKKESKSALNEALAKYKQVLPLTRIYITMIGVCTLLGLILGEEKTQAFLALDPIRVLYGVELWRPFTAATFLGPPSVGWLMNGYYLFEYGSSLERAFGTAQHLIFLLSQVFILSLLSALFGMPFFAGSMITAMLHVLSRAMPNQKVNWLVFKVPYWALPYGLMTTDVLQAGSATAALPHILGILSGHFYHFHRFVWPKTGGEDWLTAPDFVIQLLDSNAKKNAGKESLSNILKSRKRGKGKRLGSK